MQRFFRALICCLVFGGTGSSLRAQLDPTLTSERFTINDAGQPRVFELSLDELSLAGGNQTARLAPVAASSAEALRKRAEKMTRQTGARVRLVFYEREKARTEFTRRILTDEIVVRLRGKADAEAIAKSNGLIYRGRAAAAPEFAIFEATQIGGALRAAEALRALPEVEMAEPQLAHQQTKRLLPNDTYFTQQWHLRNTGQGSGLAGTDVDVTSVWDTWKGSGVRIAIVDDGLQTTHPDLSPNVDLANDHDWNDGTPDDPNPDVSEDYHGSSCAGVAAGRGNNSIGVSGAAPEATLVGLRLIAAATTDTQESEAMGWKNDIISVKSNSWGPADDARTLEGPGPITTAALTNAAQNGRGGLGTIFLWAGGNGGDVGDNSNYDGYANSIYTISIGAVDNTGVRSYYSEPGANVVVCAPSNGGTLDIVTTDLVGNDGYNATGVSGELSDRSYTNAFGGTSSAAPLAAGCVALILQANPNLGWRDVQEILIRSAKKVDPTNSDWINNAAGFHFNHNYGAGLIDVQAAVNLATAWTNLSAQTSVASAQTGLSVTIPDNNAAGITRSFDLSASNLRVEQVTVKVNIAHTSRGQLAITLISPSGTQSRLAEKHTDPGDNYTDWTFSSVRSWGENSQGTWTLKIADLTTGTTGTLSAATLTVFGTSATPLNQPATISAATTSPNGTAFTDQTLTVSSITASDPEGDAITFSYQWEESIDNVTFSSIAGATASSLGLTNAQSGKLVRCKITPNSAGANGATFPTNAVAINHRPPSLAQHGQAFTYDSDLFLAGQAANFTRSLIINEFSQGNGGSKEWVELLVLKPSNLSGYTLADKAGTYTTFRSDGFWNSVPAGTVIIIYNAADKDTTLPAETTNIASGALVLAHNNATAFTAGTWGGLSNSNAESIIVRESAAAIVDALSLNSENIYDPKLGAVAANQSAHFNGNTEIDADLLASWSIGTAGAGTVTPAAGNGGINSQFVADLRSGTLGQAPQFRLGAGSDLVPGLSIDPTSGVLGGTPNVPSGGLFQVVIERYTSSQTVSQTFQLLIVDASGNAAIPAGKTWMLGANVTLPGNLTINGAIDTGGFNLVIPGTITVAGGATIANSNGVISYRNRSGQSLPGTTNLIVDPANDAADLDGDGLTTLLEFGVGTDPSASSRAALPSVQLEGGQLQMTVTHPAGATGVVRTVEVSGDQQNWNSGPAFTQTISDTTSSGLRTWIVRDLGSGSPRSIRFRVSR